MQNFASENKWLAVIDTRNCPKVYFRMCVKVTNPGGYSPVFGEGVCHPSHQTLLL